jgi:hypothetical protein
MTKDVYLAVIRNLFSFQDVVMKKPRAEIRASASRALKIHPNLEELNLILDEMGDSRLSPHLDSSKRSSRNFVLWFRRAYQQVTANNLKGACIVLCNCILTCFGEKQIKKNEKGPIEQKMELSKQLYAKVLISQEVALPSAKNMNLISGFRYADIRTNIFLWLNMLMLEILTLRKNQPAKHIERIFVDAISTVPSLDGKCVIWSM